MPVMLQPELGPIYFWSLWAVRGGSEAVAGLASAQTVGERVAVWHWNDSSNWGRRWLQLKFEPWGRCPCMVSALSWSESLAIVRSSCHLWGLP